MLCFMVRSQIPSLDYSSLEAILHSARSFADRSYAEIGMKLVHIGGELRIGKSVNDLAVLDDVVTIRDGGCDAEVMLDQKDRKAFLLEPRNGVTDLLDDDRSQTFGWLVQHQEARARAQDARDRQHLLLTAGQFRALAVEALLQVRKQVKDLIERQSACTHHRRQQQVLPHVETGENSAFLRTERDAHARDLVGGRADDLLVVELDRAGALADDAHDRLQRGRLAGAVAPEQRDDLARVHVEIYPVQDVGLAVPGFQVAHLKDVAAGRSLCRSVGNRSLRHDRLPDRLP